jgi:uncharacterized protein
MNGQPSFQVAGRVAFDIDGVFGNIMELFIRLAREEYRIHSLRYEDITEYYLYDCLSIPPDIINQIIDKILDYPYAMEMPPFDGSVSILTRYARLYPLTFITARKKARPIQDWVRKTLNQVDPNQIQVIATGEHHLKLGVLKKLGFSYYVDDHLETCRLLHEHKITPIIFDQPWNQKEHPFYRVSNWREIGDILLKPQIDW